MSVQPQYSLLARAIEWEVGQACEAEGLGLLSWSPLASGWLTGKYRRGEPPAAGTRLSDQMDQGMRIWNERGHLERNWQVINAVRKVAEDRGASMSQVAIAWVLARPAVRSVILGARTLAQLDDNLAAGGLDLSEDETGCSTRPATREPRTIPTGSAARPSGTAASPAAASTRAAQPTADLGGDPGAVARPATRGVRVFMTWPMLFMPVAPVSAMAALISSASSSSLSSREGSREDDSLGPFGRCLLATASRPERLGRLPALPGLASEDLHDLLVAQVAGRSTRHLLIGDRGQCHPQGAHPHLVARPHRFVQIRAQPVFQFSHMPILGTGPPRRAVCGIPGLMAPWDGETANSYPGHRRPRRRRGRLRRGDRADWFALRRHEVPVLPPGSAPVRVCTSPTRLSPRPQAAHLLGPALDDSTPIW